MKENFVYYTIIDIEDKGGGAGQKNKQNIWPVNNYEYLMLPLTWQ